MTARTRLDRDLPAILEDLYLGPPPDYRTEVMAAAVRVRQRPSWTFAGRWFPMADITSRSGLVPSVPWRAIAVALLIVALLAGAAVAIVASRGTRPAPPFGVAGNGRIAYENTGDLFLLDPTSGATVPVITGPATDAQPVFSPDGTRFAFRRSNTSGGTVADDIVVANADGSNPIVIAPSPIENALYGMEWAPDARSLLVGAQGVDEVRLYDATRASPPRVIAHGAYFVTSPFRPPDGAAVMLGRAKDGGDAREWSLLDLASGKETALVTAGDPSAPRWSPDGSRVVYVDTVPPGTDTHLLFVVNADGTNPRRVTSEPDTWAEFDPVWSPDGTRIAFSRAERVGNEPWAVRPTGIVTVATGTVSGVGPLSRDVRSANPNPSDADAGADESFNLDWSPDGRWLLGLGMDTKGHLVLIDTASGDYRVLDVMETPISDRPGATGETWQRTAP